VDSAHHLAAALPTTSTSAPSRGAAMGAWGSRRPAGL